MTAPTPVPVKSAPTGSQLLKVVQALIVKLEKAEPFGINNWPTWSNEGLGGLVEQAIFHIPLVWLSWWLPIGWLLYNAASYYYERKPDPYGWSTADFVWRLVGSTAVTALLWWIA